MGLIEDSKIENIVNLAYEASTDSDESLWSEIYGKISAALSSGPGSFNLLDVSNQSFNLIADTNGPDFAEQLNDYYWELSPFKRQWTSLKPLQGFDRLKEHPDNAYLRTEWYNDFLRPRGIYQVVHRCLVNENHLTGGITVTRPESLGDFKKQEVAVLDFLAPHLRFALQIRIRLENLRREREMMSEALDRIAQGVLLVNKHRKIVFRNQKAAQLLDAGDGLRADRNATLSATGTLDNQRLRVLLRGAFEPSRMEIPGNGGLLQIGRPSGRRPLTVSVSPFPANKWAGNGSGNNALIFICDPEQAAESVEATLTKLYGLTRSEARFAKLLAEGLSLTEICEHLEIRQNTARTHLKHIFAKTETHRQSELVKLVMNAPSGLDR